MENKPKYNIGDVVFYLDYEKLKQSTVTGIFKIHKKKHSKLSDKYTLIFKEYRYFLEPKEAVETYGWKREESVFRSKEELLASL